MNAWREGMRADTRALLGQLDESRCPGTMPVGMPLGRLEAVGGVEEDA